MDKNQLRKNLEKTRKELNSKGVSFKKSGTTWAAHIIDESYRRVLSREDLNCDIDITELLLNESYTDESVIDVLVEDIFPTKEITPLNESVEKKQQLKEGTSNFGRLRYLPLLVFYTFDEAYSRLENDDDCPKESMFEDEDGNVDERAYWEAREEFEENFFDNLDAVVLDEDDIEGLKNDLYTFNEETKRIAYEADINEDGYQEYGDKLNLEDIQLEIEPGYYEANYIACEKENYFEYLPEDFRQEQLDRFNKFLKEMKKKYTLTQLGVSASFSNGETWYHEIKDESLEESKEERKVGHKLRHKLVKEDLYEDKVSNEALKKESYSLLGNEDKEILAYSNYYNAEKKAKELGLKLAEYGDNYGSDISYAYWNKSGNRYDDEEVMCYYFFDKNGKPRKEVTKFELERIADAFGISESEIDDAEEVIEESLKEDTVKQGKHWVNKGKEGTHGKFKTKKEADAQRKAMFAQGFKEEVEDTSMKARLDKYINSVKEESLEEDKEDNSERKIGKELRHNLGTRVRRHEKLIKEGPNPGAKVTLLDTDEKIIKELGKSALVKKGKSHYIVKYAPGYFVNSFDARTDEEAIKKFLGESLLKEKVAYGLMCEIKEPSEKSFRKYFDGKPIEVGTKEDMNERKKYYEDSWNLNKDGNTYKFTVKALEQEEEQEEEK